MTGKVLLVHGLLNADWWLRPLAARLRAQGFDTELFGYSSVRDGPQRAVPRLVERLCWVRFVPREDALVRLSEEPTAAMHGLASHGRTGVRAAAMQWLCHPHGRDLADVLAHVRRHHPDLDVVETGRLT